MADFHVTIRTGLRKSLIAIAFTFAASAAHASDLAATFDDVCTSPFVKSEKLEKACSAGEAPRVVQDGSRFDGRGIGGEVNTLAANLHLIARAN